jgi:hypothetical protein
MKKLVIIVIVLLFVLASCKDEPVVYPGPVAEPFTEEAGMAAFINNKDISLASSLVDTVIIGKYEIETVDIYNNIIIYSKEREGIEGFDKAYAVKTLDGEELIPFSLNSPDDFISMVLDKDILIARKENSKFSVFDLNGNAILSDIVNIESVESLYGYIRLKHTNGKSIIFNLNGDKVFGDMSLPLNKDTITFADESLIITSGNSHSIFSFTGFLIKSYFDTDTVSYSVNHLKDKRFLIVKKITVSSGEAYDYYYEDKYIKQSVFIYDADLDDEILVNTDLMIYDYANKYSFTTLQRLLRTGYSFIKAFNLNGDKTVNTDEPYIDYVVDSYCNVMLKLDTGVFPFLIYRNGVAIENNGINLRMIGLDGKILWQGEEQINTVLGLNQGVLVAGRIVDNKLKYGANDKSGGIILNYEYDALSLPFDGVYIGLKDGEYLRIEDGEQSIIDENIKSFNSLWGFYVTEQDGIQSLYNYRGVCLLDSSLSLKDIIVYTDIYNNSGTYVTAMDSAGLVRIYNFV